MRWLLIILIIASCWVLALQGRRGAKGIDQLDGHIYAHRGYHSEPDAPENSREAFRRAVERQMGSELDVHLLKDGGLAVLHDSALKRMTGLDGIVEDLTTDDLARITLGRSSETIPTLADVLAIYQGKEPLIIELKPVNKNHKELCEKVFELLDSYEGVYCVESFDPRVVRWLRKNRPEVIRGQLSMDFILAPAPQAFILNLLATFLWENFLTRPDFIAYHFPDRHNLSNQICLKLWKLRGASWTIHSREELRTAQQEGLWPIFENFEP